MRAKQDLELVPAVYWLIRLVIEFYAAKALRGIRARRKCPIVTTESSHHFSGLIDRDHREMSITKATIVETVDTDLFQGSSILAGPIPPATQLPFFRYIRTVRDNAIAGFHGDVFQQPIVETRYWRLHNFLVNDPAGIKHVLIDNADNYVKGVVELRSSRTWPHKGLSPNEGKEWRQRRPTMSSSFDYRSIFENSPVIVDGAERVLARWSTLPRGTVIEGGTAKFDVCRVTLRQFSHLIDRQSQED